MRCFLTIVLVTVVVTAIAGVPDFGDCSATMPPGPLPRFCSVLPDGTGPALAQARLLGGEFHDATIIVILMDSFGDPIFMFPFEDIWLESVDDGFVFCPGGSCADSDTDEYGQTTFSYPPHAGGSNPVGNGILVMVNSWPIPQPPLQLHFNSPDINGDLEVGLPDIVPFVQALTTGYDWRCDYNHDEAINLTDISLMTQGLGAGCN